MKSSPFFKSVSWLLLLNLLVKPVWIFGIDRQVQNVAGHEAYGRYFSILSLAVVLSFIADAGLTNMLNRQLALGNGISLQRLVRLKGLLSLLYLALLFLVALLTGVKNWNLVLLTGLLQVLTSFFIFSRNVITGYQLFGKDAWLSVVDKTLMIVLGGLFLYTPLVHRFSITAFLWLQAGCTLCALAIAWIITLRHHQENITESRDWRLLIKQAAPFVILILLMGVHGRLDAFLLERIHTNGAYEAGVYASAYRLLDAGNTAGFLAASFLVPFAARHINDLGVIEKTVLRLRHGLLLIGIGTVAVVIVFAKLIMRWLYGAIDVYHPTVLTLCIAVLPAYYLIHLYGSLLNAKGLFSRFIQVVFGSVILNIALNLFLIPGYGAWGCCVAALVSQYTCGALCFVVATKAYRLSFEWLSIAGYLAAGCFITAGCYALRHFIIG
ncbi:MAG: Membrane protein involved in the export of O-antigen and teichoic acid [Flaviaesturariibacter sp.]|nr:Membrane protein involved in the export of O-antigen and teichoic acid [Flaviaesturariibacter sp.]